MNATVSAFDSVAGLYHRLWSDWYLPAALPALEKLLFSQLSPGAEVLDVCCGCGHVTKEIVRRGYCVTGVDASEGLISIARREIPGVDWQLQDARSMQFARTYDAALCTFDSLNHILALGDLESTFHRVRRALRPDGIFVFDMNLREAFCADLHNWSAGVTDDDVSLIRGTFDDHSQTARTQLIWLHRDGAVWHRAESVIEEKCYSQTEIVAAVRASGFSQVECIPACEAGMTAEIGFGRLFVRAWP